MLGDVPTHRPHKNLARNRPRARRFRPMSGRIQPKVARAWANLAHTPRKNVWLDSKNEFGSTSTDFGRHLCPRSVRAGPTECRAVLGSNLAKLGPAPTKLGQIWAEFGAGIGRNRSDFGRSLGRNSAESCQVCPSSGLIRLNSAQCRSNSPRK